jgi:hypothetical protein
MEIRENLDRKELAFVSDTIACSIQTSQYRICSSRCYHIIYLRKMQEVRSNLHLMKEKSIEFLVH